METEWVQRSRYATPKVKIIEAIFGLLEAVNVQLEDEAAAVYVERYQCGFCRLFDRREEQADGLPGDSYI